MTLHMIFYMHFKGIKNIASMNKSKKKKWVKYMKNENITIENVIHIQHICLTDFEYQRIEQIMHHFLLAH